MKEKSERWNLKEKRKREVEKKSEEREAGIIFGSASPFGKRKIELGTVFIKKRRGEGSRHYRWLCFSLRETESRVRNCIYSILYHQIFFSFFFIYLYF